MEIIEEIIKFSIGGLTITGIIVYLGKLILTKSSDMLIENYRNQLAISKAEHQNQLEILKTEHQIRFSKLHSERGEIIKEIYQDFYDLEQKLENMTTLFQGPEWKIDKKRDDEATEMYRQTCDRLERNRIYFTEELCSQLASALEQYNNIIRQMLKAKNHAKYDSDGSGRRFPEGQGSMDLWKDAEEKTKNEIMNLRLELANVFRGLIGV
ncbi:hypothetical protein I5M32_16420 [Pedobacter sp. SD-b]|uniref:Uncharacterized protein n=1 Tax=Pedobacter segetis TaxID=2793069 RepID=A0ABS1BP48_9SPHI|nr:hypothetical protein [Pedobacter segetis]MBK0384546.1 hypothetical protein [Pedobacter segetis]